MCQTAPRATVPTRFAPLVGFFACLIAAFAAAAEPSGNAALDEAFKTLAVLELGQDLQRFDLIRQAVAASRTDEPVRADLERRLVAIVESGATDLAKDYACRQLALIGNDAALPALARLLPNPRMSYMARFALEGIGSPAAKKTLREMLGKTEGRQKMGAVISLGSLADAEAVPAIAALLEEDNRELREACLVALGRIGTVRAADALQAFAKRSGAKPETVDALLDAAESLCRHGQHQAAAGICQSLLAADSEFVRAAAFRGLVAAKPAESLAMITAGLGGKEAWKRAVAADCVAELEKPEEIRAIAAAIAHLPDEGKIAAFLSLKDRSDPAIRQAALKLLGERGVEVRTAALAALVRSAAADDVAALAALVTGGEDPQVREAAFETLRLMPAQGVNRALIARLGENPSDLLVRCALARRSPEFVPEFLEAAASSHPAVRLEALKALEVMASEKELEALVGLLCKTPPGEEREAADRAVWMSCQKTSDPAAQRAPLLAAMAKSDETAQSAILPSLARLGGKESLVAVRKSMRSANEAVRDAGHRALANWPDATVADELLEIAKTSSVEVYRVWSLRAYARLVALPSDRPPPKTFEMLAGAMKLASRTEDRALFIERLAAVRVPESLALLLPLIDDADLRNAAVPAVFTLAKGLSQSHPAEAAAALEKIRPLATDPAIAQQIPKVLRDIESRKQGKK